MAAEQTTDLYGVACEVDEIATFPTKGLQFGAGHTLEKPSEWFVYTRIGDDPWHMHCGPYSTKEQATTWILDLV